LAQHSLSRSSRDFCQYQAKSIRSTSTSSRCSTRLCSIGPLLFILDLHHTTPLSSLIFDSYITHHLYADDTQLLISFSALDFTVNIVHLTTTIGNVSAWMSANLLSLKQSKTEFLLIGLPQQLSTVVDPTLFMPSNVTVTPTNSARNLGVIFDCCSIAQISFSEHISSVSKSCFLSIRDLVEFGTLSTIPLLKPSL